MAYPSVIAALTNPNPTDRLNSPSHSSIESAQNNNITAIQNFVGVDGAASIVGTMIYDARSPASNGGGHVQTAVKGGTGQITYTKGDILVAQSSSVLSKLAVGGTQGQALVVDNTQAVGVKWGVPGSAPTIRIFSVVSGAASSVFTWAKPANLNYIAVQVQGPGGGGGSVLGNSKSGQGGGGGGFAFKVIAASVLGATEEVRVGKGGGLSSTISTLSSFGLSNTFASVVGNPGSPGAQASGTVSGGTATGGDINIDGGTSKKAATMSTTVNIGGDGGDAILGNCGSGGVANESNSTAPTGYGAGGGGSSSNSGGATGVPSMGAPGVVIIYEY